MAKVYPLQETCKTCPNCGGIMQLVEGPKRQFTLENTEDGDTEVTWWDCLDCDHQELVEKK